MKKLLYFILALCLPLSVEAQQADVSVVVTTPGTLGSLILQQAESLQSVERLTVSGTLNDDDMNVIGRQLTSLVYANMQGVTNETFSSTFRGNTVLQQVVLPQHLTETPANLFYGCSSLTDVVLPPSLRSIAMQTFCNCRALTSIDLPVGLQSIGDWAFQDCRSLAAVVLPQGLTSLGSSAFSGCTGLVSISLPGTLAVVPDGAFKNTGQLQSLTLPEGIQEIGSDAFRNAFASSAQVELVLPSTLRVVGENAFNGQPIVSLQLNEGLRQLRSGCFSATALTEVSVPSTVTYAREPFYNCRQLSRIVMLPIVPPACYGYYLVSSRASDLADRVLVVPAVSQLAYQQTKGYDNFATYATHDQLPSQLSVVGDFAFSTPAVDGWHPDVVIDNDRNNGSSENNGFGTLTLLPGEGLLSVGRLQLLYDAEMELWNKFRWHDARRNPYGTVSTGYAKNFSSIVAQGAMRADEIVVDATFYVSRWQTLCLPFDCQMSDIEPLSPNTFFSIREYDAAARAAGNMGDTWRVVAPGEMLRAGHGYMICGVSYKDVSSLTEQAFTLRFRSVNNASKNRLFSTASETVQLSDQAAEFEHNRGWNLVGNPYPCYVNSGQTTLSVPFTIWNAYDKKYESLRQPDDAYVFSPFEAFFVQRSDAQSQLTFLAEGRQTSRTLPTGAASRQMRTGGQRHVLNIVLSQGQQQDRTRVVLNEEALAGYEADKDAPKMRAADSDASLLYTLHGGMEYAISERPLADGCALLGMTLGSDAPCCISLLSSDATAVWLTDRERGTTVQLDADGYCFTAQPGPLNDRFVLTFGDASAQTTAIATQPATASPAASTTFSLQGLPAAARSKGVYIRNGKKVIVK